MPTPTTIKIDPQDLQKNISLGISIPFNAPGVFNGVYSTKDNAKFRLFNLLLTSKGEKIYNYDFGCGVNRYVFEPLDEAEGELLKNNIVEGVMKYISEINIDKVSVNLDKNRYMMNINVQYSMKISGENDQIIIDFQR